MGIPIRQYTGTWGMRGMFQLSIWGFPEMGNTPKWLVYFMDNPTKMDDLGVPLFWEITI
jgi:hypothetical protein